MWSSLFYFGAYRRSIELVQRNIEDSMELSLDNMYREQAKLFSDMERISNLIFSNRTLQRLVIEIEDSDSYIDQFYIYNQIIDITNNHKINFPNYEIRLYLESYTFVTSQERVLFPTEKIKNEKWYPEVVKAEGSIVWNTNFYKWDKFFNEVDAISQIRLFKNTEPPYQSLGILSVSLDKKIIQNNLKQSVFTDGVGSFIFSEDKMLITSAGVIGEGKSEIIKRVISNNTLQDNKIYLDEQNIIVFHRYNPENGWINVLTIPYKYIYSEDNMK